MAVRLWLVRHGATRWSEEGRYAGWTDIELAPSGRRQALGLRASLDGRSWTGVWASDLRRATETAALAGFTPVLDARLRELDFGDIEGRRFGDLDRETAAALMSFDGFRAAGGESVTELEARVTRFLDDLPEGDHLLFTHGGVIRTILRPLGLDGPIRPGLLAGDGVVRT